MKSWVTDSFYLLKLMILPDLIQDEKCHNLSILKE